MEAAARLDRRSDDDELGPPLGRDARHLLPEQARTRADELAPDADSVRGGHVGGGVEAPAQGSKLGVEARLERQLALDDERRNEHNACAAIRGEPTGEVEGVLRLLPLEKRHDDAAVGDRARPAREAAGAAAERADVGASHRRSG